MTKRGWTTQTRKASNLALARAYVMQYAPYLSATLYGLIPTPTPGLTAFAGGPLAVTERLVLYFEPEWIESVSVQVLATGLAHECLHDQLRHVARGKSYPDKKQWNRAGDLFINGTMRTQMKQVRRDNGVQSEPMWEFPEWTLMPEKYGFPVGLSADEYYRLLDQLPKKSAGALGPQPGNGGGEGDEKGSDPKDQEIMCGSCGGVAGNPLSDELEGGLNHDHGRSEADCRSIAKSTAQQIQKYMETHQGRGNIPGQWAELIQISDEVFVVPWRSKLSNLTRYSISRARTGGLDYSRRRASKRSYLRGIQLPSLIAYDPNVFFLLDSSGSMGSKQLSDALRICSDVLVQTGVTEAWFMEADTTSKREPIKVRPRDLRKLEILGRGGTDFRPAIQFIDEEFKPRPSIVIYLTDGDGQAPEVPPAGINFIWCVVPTPYARKPAEWGELIWLNDNLPDPVDEDDDA